MTSERRMPGCPSCGSDRLRRRHHALGVIVALASGKRRYRCSACGWSGWRHRLKRHRGSGGGAPRGIRAGAGAGEAVRAALLALAVLLVVWLASYSCNALRSTEPADAAPPVSQLLHLGPVRLA